MMINNDMPLYGKSFDLANMQIFINALDGAIHRLDVAPETTVAQIKRNLGADEHILSYGSSILDDSLSLSNLDITEGASLAINARLLGGKVHGSLARAGKVRAQTPKVEKQEKKKKKKGEDVRHDESSIREGSSMWQLDLERSADLTPTRLNKFLEDIEEEDGLLKKVKRKRTKQELREEHVKRILAAASKGQVELPLEESYLVERRKRAESFELDVKLAQQVGLREPKKEAKKKDESVFTDADFAVVGKKKKKFEKTPVEYL
ncbi:hypothetical protein GCK32_006968 [Trichostrongylus colubriformis]|uniref:Ubiquitin-like domain-containing protein n=1 Tax=Trichostrongylus colubriformis TaxID=6319 RepID=A0AAN8FRA1_TRICO